MVAAPGAILHGAARDRKVKARALNLEALLRFLGILGLGMLRFWDVRVRDARVFGYEG